MKPTMLSYIEKEQNVLLDILKQYSAIKVPKGLLKPNSEILVLATGSSINAAQSTRHFVEEKLGVRVNIQEPFNFLHYGHFAPDTSLVVGISQSGQSTATIDAINSLKKHGIPSIAVTTVETSEICAVVDHVLLVKSGVERVGYVTLGYLSTMLEIYLHALKLSVDEGYTTSSDESYLLESLHKNLNTINKIQQDTFAFFERFEADFKTAHRFSAIGYGPNYGTVKEMETKFSETIRVASTGYDLEAYMHGPYLEVNKDHHIFFVMNEAPVLSKSELLYNYESKHAHTYQISTQKSDSKNVLYIDTDLPEFLTPLLLTVPFQILSWFIAGSKGIDLTQRIYTDFSQAVKSKTKVQDYV